MYVGQVEEERMGCGWVKKGLKGMFEGGRLGCKVRKGREEAVEVECSVYKEGLERKYKRVSE